MTAREPLLNPVRIDELRPTQITVGLREVAEKRRQWRGRDGDAGAVFLGRHMIPAVLGPRGRLHIVDHHHLCLALHQEGVEEVLVEVLADLSGLKRREFWTFLDCRGWCHAYDAEGKRQGFSAIPDHVAKMTDDRYRSLAGELRRAGGYAKETTPFSEFIWADFLRRRVGRELVDEDFAAALTHALELARSPQATHLPGWCGPDLKA